jgi:hypothetical protein
MSTAQTLREIAQTIDGLRRTMRYLMDGGGTMMEGQAVWAAIEDLKKQYDITSQRGEA